MNLLIYQGERSAMRWDGAVKRGVSCLGFWLAEPCKPQRTSSNGKSQLEKVRWEQNLRTSSQPRI